jgi:type IV secretory pathway VirB4 component
MQENKNKDKYPSFQDQMDVAEIKENVIVLKDGSLRAVLAVSSINFDLKSDQEQEGLIFAYQGFLNSFDFPFQIVISSKKFDVDPYLSMLKRKGRIETNELLRRQIEDYTEFVDELVGMANIMTKLFYVIVPFYSIENKQKGFLNKISSTINPRKTIYQKKEDFETYKNQLFQRVDQVSETLSGTGVKMVPLNTEELIELFYNSYNPSEFEYVKIKDLNKMELEKK